MKKLKRSLITSILVILVIGFIGYRYYSPKDAPIKGLTNQEIVNNIRERVDANYIYTSVTASVLGVRDDPLSSDEENGPFVLYVYIITVPIEWLAEPTTQAEYTRKKEIIEQYQNGISDLMLLTMKHAVPNNPRLKNIIIRSILPNGAITQAIIPIKQLRPLLKTPDNVDAWYEQFLMFAKDLEVPE